MRKMTPKENREILTKTTTVEPEATPAPEPAYIWQPDVQNSEEDFSINDEEQRRMYANDFHDDERIQFQREIMAADNGYRGADNDEDEEEDSLYEEDGLLHTRYLISNNEGKLICLYNFARNNSSGKRMQKM